MGVGETRRKPNGLDDPDMRHADPKGSGFKNGVFKAYTKKTPFFLPHFFLTLSLSSRNSLCPLSNLA